MKTSAKCFIFLSLSWVLFSCTYNDIGKTPTKSTEPTWVVGSWNSYEMKEATTIVPGIGSNLTLMYENGLVFTADGKFGPRYYDAGVWEENSNVGTYSFTNDKILTLVFAPGTKDELSLPLQIIKLDSNYFWFQHSFWVNDQNPYPIEVHLERAK